MALAPYLSWDGARAILVLLFAVSQALMAFWPELRRWPQTIATRSAGLDTPVVPVSGTFAIWGLIFAGCIAFGIWQALPHNLQDPFARTVGWVALAVFAANTAWEFVVPKRGFGWSSITLIMVEAVGLAIILLLVEWGWRGLTWTTFWLVAAPFHLFAGWVTAAVIVNLSSVLRAKGVTVGPSISILLLMAAGIIALAATWQLSSPICALAVCWALGGIIVAAQGDQQRRSVLATAVILAIALVATAAAGIVSRVHEPRPPLASMPRDGLPPIRFVSTPDLQIAYLAYGPETGPVVLAFHGFPDDASSWHEVASALADQGYRVLAPYLRGFGETRFHSPDAVRTGQLAALVTDAAAFVDALSLKEYTLIGHDWGGRIAQGLTVLRPHQASRLVSFSGYALAYGLDGPPALGFLPELTYQFALNLPIGEAVLAHGKNPFLYGLWRRWSPGWPEDTRSAAFAQAVASFNNPDFIAVVLSAYSYVGKGHDPRYAALEARFAEGPPVPASTHILQGADDPLERPGLSAELDRMKFIAGLSRQVLPNTGHWAHRENPRAIVAAVRP